MRSKVLSLLANTAGNKRTSFRWAAPAALAATASALTATVVASTGGSVVGTSAGPSPEPHIQHQPIQIDRNQKLENWSGTTKVVASQVFRPRSVQELQYALSSAVEQGLRVRCIGSGLSPNGMGLWSGALVSVEHLDKLLDVDATTGCVTVQAGMLVGQFIEELREHGLTLANVASVSQQQLGGLYQVGAHGTGASIPPVEEQIVGLKLATPSGELLSIDKSHPMFALAKCGLGALGVVHELTIQCVPLHWLEERTEVMTRSQVQQGHRERLSNHKHVRYMWIPYEDVVVVVTSDECAAEPENEDEDRDEEEKQSATLDDNKNKSTSALSSGHTSLMELLSQADSTSGPSIQAMQKMSFADLRSLALGNDALNLSRIRTINAAEASHWKEEAERVGNQVNRAASDAILGFDCGGRQLVYEIAFPADHDLAVPLRLLQELEAKGVAAPGPIEQRWTASSSSTMSPARGEPGQVFSWIGIIMYLNPNSNTNSGLDANDDTANENKNKNEGLKPTDDKQVQIAFRKYKQLYRDVLDDLGVAYRPHWAKSEDYPKESQPEELIDELVRDKMLRYRIDPTNTMSNPVVDVVVSRMA